MKKATVAVLLFIGLNLTPLFGQDLPPAPSKLVSDFTNTLSSSEVNDLERKLLAFEDSTSIQIAVVLINSTNGYDIADYAVRLAQKWGVGQSKYDNGVMVLAALGDRAVTIQTGYGIEGAVPDAIAFRIIENDIKPNFRRNAYYDGLNSATSSIIAYTKGEYKADSKEKGDSRGKGSGGLFVIIIVVVVIALISRGGGGGKNKGGRMMDGKGTSDLFWWALLHGLAGGGGRSSGSGGFGGGGFGGGSGGFGGFGGGGFGGGGASGRW
ncbi:TPM domain-containing protein [Sphingobacterium pedocola]|uniref:Methanol dehydrogenase n=1 Tax=Sphingobacterium pedocola TaxID=2082722 RepID=A0ABR9TBV7_9SPHI|nr:TPM domain-containing protein [Sphingobacterium pedocola]MBE8722852.1 methanol dehydrogenase [Sphingobacterium pedocola]